MQNVPVRTVFDVITDFLATYPTPEAILAYHLPLICRHALTIY
jgi:hypothetical protein